MADRSASICFSLWNEQAAAIEAGDILKLTKGSLFRFTRRGELKMTPLRYMHMPFSFVCYFCSYASLWKGSMVLYSGKYGKLEKIGE